MKNFLRYIFILIALVAVGLGKVCGQTSISLVGTSATQDFNILAFRSAGTWTDGSTNPLKDWYASGVDPLTPFGIVIPTAYGLNTGSTVAAGLYSFGLSANSNRALGWVPNGTTSSLSYYGWRLKNTSGSTIKVIEIKWRGQQWRKTSAGLKSLDLSYQTGNSMTSLTTGSFTAIQTFNSPLYGTAGNVVLDGNSGTNYVDYINYITVNLAAGQEIMLRWADTRSGASQQLLAIDNIVVTPQNDQTITFSDNLTNKTFGGSTFGLTATSTSGLPIEYVSSNLNIATISGSTVTMVGPGKAIITAKQAGNASYSPAVNVTQEIWVKPSTPTIDIPTNITSSSFDVNWTAQNGNNNANTAYKIEIDTNPLFNSPPDEIWTANEVNTANTTDGAGLITYVPDTKYYYRIYAVIDGLYSVYSQASFIITGPNTQANNIVATPTFTTSALTFVSGAFNWSNGDPTGRVLFLKEGTGAITSPSNNTTYTASTNWSSLGTQLGSSGYYCIYAGSGNSVTVTGLYPGRTYTVQAFEYQGLSGTEVYLTTEVGANNPITFVPWPTTTWTNSPSVGTPEAWNTTARWDHATVPTNSLHPAVIVYIDGNCEVTDAAESNNLTILASHGGTNPKLTINPSKSMTIGGTIAPYGALVNEAGASGLVIKTDPTQALANGSLIYKKTDNGTVASTVEMYSKASWNLSDPVVNNRYTWQFFGIPVTSLATTPTFDGVYARIWKETGTLISNHWALLTNDSTLKPFRGYEITQSAPKTYSFTGNLVNTDFSQSNLAYTSSALYPGQHIFANPYTAAINIASLTGAFGSNMENAVYLYNAGTYSQWETAIGDLNTGSGAGQYTVSTPSSAGQSGVPAQIPSMQAFLVKAKTNDVDYPINNSLAFSYTSVVGTNTELQRAPSTQKTIATRIDIRSTHFADRMWIFTDSTCTRNYDKGWDGTKLMGSPRAPQLFAIEPDGKYQINAVADMNNTDLGFITGEEKEFTIKFTHENADKQYSSIYLYDLVAKTSTDITLSGSEYKFTAEPNTKIVKRFKIITSNLNETSKEESQMKIYSADGMILIENSGVESGELKIYDMSGRYIQQTTFGANKTTAVFKNLSSGVYLAKTLSNGKEITKSFIVR
ncbi:MAG: T9SS type A sorting domain-containing protein [Paludibacter sp.]